MWQIISTTSEYTQQTLSKTHNTLENSRTLKQRSSQYLQKQAYKTTTHITTKHSPLNKDANAETSIITEQYNP